MGLARFYLPELVQGNFEFAAEEERHIAGAKRLSVGDEFEVFDGKGSYTLVKITQLKSRRVGVEPIAEIRYTEKVAPLVQIAVAVPKGKRLQYMIEKLSEIGVDSIVPVVYTRSVAGGDEPVQKYTRWAVEACKQSRNSWIPEFCNPVKFNDYLETNKSPLLMADYTGGSILKLFDNASTINQNYSCLIGPEGGFTDEEFELADKYKVKKIRLANNILRIETAAVAFASAVLAVTR